MDACLVQLVTLAMEPVRMSATVDIILRETESVINAIQAITAQVKLVLD